MRVLLTSLVLFLGGLTCATAAEFKPTSNPPGMEITGEILPGDAARLARLLAQNAPATPAYNLLNVMLDSPGGSVDDALKIAAMMESWHSFTIIKRGGVCASACTILWSAGLVRILGAESRLGFHRLYARAGTEASITDLRRQIEPASDAVSSLYQRNGIPRALIARALETPAADVFWVDNRVILDQAWGRAIYFNPVLLDQAEQQCGREPITQPGGFTRDGFSRWMDCADGVRMRSLRKTLGQR